MSRRRKGETVGDIMTSNPVTVRSGTTIVQLRRLFDVHDFNMFPVVDERGVLRGVVTKLDLLKVYRPWSPGRLTVNVRALFAERVEDIMSRGLTSLTPGDPVSTAVTLMVNRRLRSIPVVTRQTRDPVLVGIVSRDDVLQCLPVGGPTEPA
jgi:CBS-domain-containing membrane protein